MLKYLIPTFNFKEFLIILKFALWGAVIAGLYGIVHDLFTYNISPEYYTKLKFKQFSYLESNIPNKYLAAIIGFQASWWVGFFSGWFICRILFIRKVYEGLFSKLIKSFFIIFSCALTAALTGFLLGGFHNDDYSAWLPVCRLLKISDIPSFVQVAYIHNASYIGGAGGLFIVLICIFKSSFNIKKNTESLLKPYS